MLVCGQWAPRCSGSASDRLGDDDHKPRAHQATHAEPGTVAATPARTAPASVSKYTNSTAAAPSTVVSRDQHPRERQRDKSSRPLTHARHPTNRTRRSIDRHRVTRPHARPASTVQPCVPSRPPSLRWLARSPPVSQRSAGWRSPRHRACSSDARPASRPPRAQPNRRARAACRAPGHLACGQDKSRSSA